MGVFLGHHYCQVYVYDRRGPGSAPMINAIGLEESQGTQIVDGSRRLALSTCGTFSCLVVPLKHFDFRLSTLIGDAIDLNQKMVTISRT